METIPINTAAQPFSISELLRGSLEIEESTQMTYLLPSTGEKIYRCRVTAIIVQRQVQGQMTNLLIDDGTGMLLVRCFEDHPALLSLLPGTCGLFLGKIRSYQKEIYLAPEIMKKVHPAWAKVHAFLCRQKYGFKSESHQTTPLVQNKRENKIVQDTFPQAKVIQLIQQLDRGDGAFIEEILEKSALQETELLLQKMLEKGDIFQIIPGKVKVL